MQTRSTDCSIFTSEEQYSHTNEVLMKVLILPVFSMIVLSSPAPGSQAFEETPDGIYGSGIAENIDYEGDIVGMPDTGLVYITGRVKEVENRRKFTLADQTGTLKVDAKALVDISPGDLVSVVGYVDESIASDEVNATEIFVRTENDSEVSRFLNSLAPSAEDSK
jgi:uncharacterized protein YdeI (BOF family)